MNIKTIKQGLEKRRQSFRDLQEKIIRRNNSDVIEIGELAEKFYNSQAGELLRAIINDRKAREAEDHQRNPTIPADRILGRIEAYQNILNDFELMIEEKTRLLRPIQE